MDSSQRERQRIRRLVIDYLLLGVLISIIAGYLVWRYADWKAIKKEIRTRVSDKDETTTTSAPKVKTTTKTVVADNPAKHEALLALTVLFFSILILLDLYLFFRGKRPTGRVFKFMYLISAIGLIVMAIVSDYATADLLLYIWLGTLGIIIFIKMLGFNSVLAVRQFAFELVARDATDPNIKKKKGWGQKAIKKVVSKELSFAVTKESAMRSYMKARIFVHQIGFGAFESAPEIYDKYLLRVQEPVVRLVANKKGGSKSVMDKELAKKIGVGSFHEKNEQTYFKNI